MKLLESKNKAFYQYMSKSLEIKKLKLLILLNIRWLKCVCDYKKIKNVINLLRDAWK